jgi:hypothetical protein
MILATAVALLLIAGSISSCNIVGPGQVGIIVNMTGTQRVRVRIPHHIRLDIRESDPTACLRISNICTNRKMDSYPDGRKYGQ